MMETPKISIVVPIYNNTQYLKECLDSILNQTVRPYEIILVDDGSDRQHADYIDGLASENEFIKVFHKENGGQLSSRMFGIERAEGEWVAFVDSDDRITRNMIEALKKEIANEPTIDCIIFSYKRFAGDSYLPGDEEQGETRCIITDKRELYRRVLLDESYNSIWRKICRKRLFTHNLEQYYDGRFAEDLIQSIEIYRNGGNILFLDLPLYEYRDNESSITNTVRDKKYRIDLAPYKRAYDLLIKENVFLEGDWLQYSSFSKKMLIDQLKRLVISSTPYRDSHIQMNGVRGTEYYNGFLLKATANMTSFPDHVLFLLFKHKCDHLLYGIGRIRRLLP